jgi:hypothetical protein
MKKTKSASKNNCPCETEPKYWFRSSGDVRTGYVSGNSFEMKPVKYGVVGELAIFEGDIVLGKVEHMERISNSVADPENMPVSGVVITGDRFRWPKAVIPYVIDPGLVNPQRVTDAMAHWSAQTPLRFVPRDSGNPAHENYISIEQQDGCWSEVGMRGGKQVVSIGVGCSVGSAIHELGHVAGLWHEQSREDRDQFIRILWENIEEGREYNFDQHITDGDDLGGYDYDSIMHYPALAFSRNGQPTILTKAGQAIGQRNGSSPGDIAAVRAMYPNAAVPEVTSPGPARTESGVQRVGTVPALDSRRFLTQDWPAEWSILWSVVPSPASARVEWNLVTERQSEKLLKYYVEVRNLSQIEATIDIRYTIFQ